MGYWSVVIPEATTNLLADPSFEFGTLATYWTAGGGGGTGTTVLSTAKAVRGYNSVLCTGGSLGATVYQSVTTAAASHTLSCYLQRSDGAAVTSSDAEAIIDGAGAAFDSITAVGGGWYYCLKTASETAAAHDTGVSVAAGATVYLDCVQFEAKAYATTYCDGSEPGCTWTGGANMSTSTRSAQYRGGGRVRDFLTDYDVGVVAMEGWGLPPVNAAVTEYAMLPGGLVQGQKVGPRQWQLVFEAAAPALASIHTARDYLVEAFKPDLVSPAQPVRLRYSGATTTVEIDAWYVGGLEGSLVGEEGVAEQPVARLLSENPFWYSLVNGSAVLDGNLTVSNADCAAKRVGGLWSNITTDFNNTVYCFDRDSQQRTYIGGAFTSAGSLEATRIVRYDPDGSLNALTGDVNNIVRAVLATPDDKVYIGGDFTSAGATANTGYVARWDGSTWYALSTGTNAAVRALALKPADNVIVGGDFTSAGTAVAYIASWTSCSWQALGAGMNDAVYALAVDHNGTLYAGGLFTQAGGTVVNCVAKWNGTTWEAMGSGLDNACQTLTVGADNSIYAGGTFHAAGGISASHVARWTGSRWEPLADGLVEVPTQLAADDSGRVWAISGWLGTVDGIERTITMWNGSEWVPGDIIFPKITDVVNPQGLAVFGEEVFVGYEATGSAYASAQTTVTNTGSRTAYPRLKVKRVGGENARLAYLKNETTGDTLYLSYFLGDQETLTIDLNYRPDPVKPSSKLSGAKRINSSVFGDVIGRALLPGSDLAEFGLAPGANTISLFVAETGTPTITAWLEWRVPYWSPDGAV